MRILLRAGTTFGLALIILNSHALAQAPGLMALKADLHAAQPQVRLARQVAGLFARAGIADGER